MQEDETDKDKEFATKVHNVLNNIATAEPAATTAPAAAGDGPSMT